MYWPTEGLKQNSERKGECRRGTEKLLIMVILLFWVTSKQQTLENVRAIAIHSVPKVFWVISAVVLCPYPYIHPFAQIQRPSLAFLHLSHCLSFFLSAVDFFLVTFEGHVCLAQSDIFNSVSFGLHVGLKAHKLHQKLHTNCIRLPTCWKGKLLANLLWVLTSSPVWWKFWSNWSPALLCGLIMRVREHLLDCYAFVQ